MTKALTTGQISATPRGRGRPKGDSRLEEVLTVAAASFTARGYALTTLEDIGTELGMTRPALYYYAKSKEELLVLCYDWTYQRFQDRLAEVLDHGSGRDRLRRFFAVYSEIVCDNVSRCFLSTETHHLNPERQRLAANRVRGITNIVSDLIEEGVVDGSLASCDRKYATAALFGAFNSLPRLLRDGGPKPVEMGAAMLDILLEGLLPRPGA